MIPPCQRALPPPPSSFTHFRRCAEGTTFLTDRPLFQDRRRCPHPPRFSRRTGYNPTSLERVSFQVSPCRFQHRRIEVNRSALVCYKGSVDKADSCQCAETSCSTEILAAIRIRIRTLDINTTLAYISHCGYSQVRQYPSRSPIGMR